MAADAARASRVVAAGAAGITVGAAGAAQGSDAAPAVVSGKPALTAPAGETLPAPVLQRIMSLLSLERLPAPGRTRGCSVLPLTTAEGGGLAVAPRSKGASLKVEWLEGDPERGCCWTSLRRIFCKREKHKLKGRMGSIIFLFEMLFEVFVAR